MTKKITSLVLVLVLLLMTTVVASAHDYDNSASDVSNESFGDFYKVSTEELESVASVVGVSFEVDKLSVGEVTLSKQTYQEVTDKNNVSVAYDEEGNIVRINAIYATDYSLTSQREDLIQKAIFDTFDLTQDYESTEIEIYGDYSGYSYVRVYENGLKNPFESVKVTCYSNNKQPVILTNFSFEPNTTEPQIDEETAKEAALQSEYYADESVLTSCELTFVLPAIYMNDNVSRYNDDYSYLSYKLVYDNDYVIYVDATDASVIAVDEIMLYDSASFILSEVSASVFPSAYNRRNSSTASCIEFNGYRNENLILSEAGFARLGYNVDQQSNPYTSSALVTDIDSFIGGNNSYGFYFCGHGSENVLCFKYNNVLHRNNVEGNWRFVFLDGCNTAVNSNWASAFNIYGYSGRAYLGWFDTVLLANTHQFQEYFWPRLGLNNIKIQKLAVDAANSVPGDGTTPIRFYGDNNYTGIE